MTRNIGPGNIEISIPHHDRSPFTSCGNRTHVAVPEDLLTTTDLYHSTTEVLIEFDAWAYITSHSRGDFASWDLLYPLSTFLSTSGLTLRWCAGVWMTTLWCTYLVFRFLNARMNLITPTLWSQSFYQRRESNFFAVPKDLVTTTAIYHSATEVLRKVLQ